MRTSTNASENATVISDWSFQTRWHRIQKALGYTKWPLIRPIGLKRSTLTTLERRRNIGSKKSKRSRRKSNIFMIIFQFRSHCYLKIRMHKWTMKNRHVIIVKSKMFFNLFFSLRKNLLQIYFNKKSITKDLVFEWLKNWSVKQNIGILYDSD